MAKTTTKARIKSPLSQQINRQNVSVDELKLLLDGFFSNNPYSCLDDPGENDPIVINKPWGDSSLQLVIDENYLSLIDSLNALILPERLSAVYHINTRKLEIIWTSYNLPKSQQEIVGRTFKFRYKNIDHECSFTDSSTELLTLARSAKPITISETNHRNIQSFSNFSKLNNKTKSNIYDRALSFWISDVDLEESMLIDLLSNLSFYLGYFDYLSPTIVIHPPSVASVQTPPKRTRYVSGAFPKRIDAECLDENLLSFWDFADSGNPMMRFLLYYRILEYGASHYVDSSIRHNIRKLLHTPNLRDNPDLIVDQIVTEMGASKLSDAQRLQAVVRQCVSPAHMWRDISANLTFFSKDTKFDGGFSVRAIVGSNETEATFSTRGLDGFCDAVRKIRNAVSHGRDQETSGVIRPSSQNFKLFQPWVHLIAVAAGEVVLYRGNA